MRHTRKTNRRRQRGFSLTELMVSISIVVLLIGITFPVISVMTSGSRIEAGLNIVGMSADVTRQWVADSAWANDGCLVDAINESYSGTAAIYCPTGEIRITLNNRNARNTGGAYLEDLSPALNGYIDRFGIDYIIIPDGVGIAGIQRTGAAANDVSFLAPPFAIAFNESGQLSYGDTGGRIYYDGNGDSQYDTTTGGRRPGGYDPKDWNGLSGSNNENVISATKLIKRLPFEGIECVTGIVVYNLEDFENASFDFAGGGQATFASGAGQWLKENGETIFFSPHTGVALRDEQKD